MKEKIVLTNTGVKKDLLSLALESGINFPHSCRTGGCGRCRCRLLTGEIEEQSNHDYICSSAEIKNGFILACQSIPLTQQVEIELENNDLLSKESDHPQMIKTRAKFLDYLKFFFFHFVGIFSLLCLIKGGIFQLYGFITVVLVFTIGDYLSGEDLSYPDYNTNNKSGSLLIWQLWLALPLLFATVFVFIRGSSNAYGDREPWYWTLSGLFLTALMVGTIGTVTAHELTHRTWDKVSMLIGRWLLAFSFDTPFSIEHVYGHHRTVATGQDPATAPRGRNVYAHIWHSTFKGHKSAWTIEKERLKKRNISFISWDNQILSGHLISIFLLSVAYVLNGLIGVLAFSVVGILGKCLLEIVNYMEHYGIVRHPDGPVCPRHSWNSNQRLSSWMLFNLTRHSHHHAHGDVSYYDLRPYPRAPKMLSGYLSTIVLALIPPLWFKLMEKKLSDWDMHFASVEEKIMTIADNSHQR